MVGSIQNAIVSSALVAGGHKQGGRTRNKVRGSGLPEKPSKDLKVAPVISICGGQLCL